MTRKLYYLLVVLLLVIAGCKQEQSIESFTLQDFKKSGVVLPDGDPHIESTLGKTKETAAVVLLFKSNGTLYTKEDVADLQQYAEGKLKVETYWTDLANFYTVTKLPYATVDYVMGIPMNPTSQEVRYVLDPYRQEQIPYSEREKRAMERL